MTILQLFQETFSDPSMYGYMGVGSGIGASAEQLSDNIRRMGSNFDKTIQNVKQV